MIIGIRCAVSSVALNNTDNCSFSHHDMTIKSTKLHVDACSNEYMLLIGSLADLSCPVTFQISLSFKCGFLRRHQ